MDWVGPELAVLAIVLLSYIICRLIGDFLVLLNSKVMRVNDISSKSSETCGNFGTKLLLNAPGKSGDIQIEKKDKGQSFSRRGSREFANDIDGYVKSRLDVPHELGQLIGDLCNKHYDAASAMFFHARSLNVLTHKHVTSSIFLSLTSSCIRVGSPQFVFKYFTEMDQLSIPRDLAFYSSILKLLTFKKYYKIALSINGMYFNVVGSFRDGDEKSLQSVYSCLLLSSVETKEFWRSGKFFKQIRKTSLGPTERDYSNISKALIAREDWNGCAQMIASFGVPTDLNRRCLLCLVGYLISTNDSAKLELLLSNVRNSAALGQILGILAKEDCQMVAAHIPRILRQLSEVGLDIKSVDVLISLLENADHELIETLARFITTIPSAEYVTRNTIALVNGLLRKCTSVGVLEALMAKLSIFGPNLDTFAALFDSAVCTNVKETLQILRLFEHEHQAGRVGSPHGGWLNGCLRAMLRQKVNGRSNWIAAVATVTDVVRGKFGISTTPIVSNETCGILVSILLQSSNTVSPNEEESKYFFEECWKLITVTTMNSFGIIPSLDLYLQALLGAVSQGNILYVGKFFQQMCDQHYLNIARMASGEDDMTAAFGLESLGGGSPVEVESMITAETVNTVLAAALRQGDEMFLLALEIVLLNKLKLNYASFTKLIPRVAEKARLGAILHKYKYRIPPRLLHAMK